MLQEKDINFIKSGSVQPNGRLSVNENSKLHYTHIMQHPPFKIPFEKLCFVGETLLKVTKINSLLLSVSLLDFSMFFCTVSHWYTKFGSLLGLAVLVDLLGASAGAGGGFFAGVA